MSIEFMKELLLCILVFIYFYLLARHDWIDMQWGIILKMELDEQKARITELCLD